MPEKEDTQQKRDSNVSKKTAEHQLGNELKADTPETKKPREQADPADVSEKLVDDVKQQLDATIKKYGATQSDKPTETEKVKESTPEQTPPAESVPDNLPTEPNEPSEEERAPAIAPPEKDTAVEPENTKAVKKENGVIRRLRTYKDDIARALKTQNASVTTIASAEQKRRAKQTPAPTQKRDRGTNKQAPFKVIALILGAVLVLGAGSFGAYVLLGNTGENTQVNASFPEYIRVNEVTTLAIPDNETGRALLTRLNAEKTGASLSLGNVRGVVLAENNADGGAQQIHPRTFFNAIEAAAPPALLRTFGETFAFGIHAFDGNQPFLLIPVDGFQTAFAEMLAWEDDLNATLAPLFGPNIGRFSTPPGSGAPSELRVYEDVVIQNHDVRVLKDDAGEIALLYAFPSSNFLLITTNRHTFIEVVDRLRSTRVIQKNQ